LPGDTLSAIDHEKERGALQRPPNRILKPSAEARSPVRFQAGEGGDDDPEGTVRTGGAARFFPAGQEAGLKRRHERTTHFRD
jgi:hypothetical protein